MTEEQKAKIFNIEVDVFMLGELIEMAIEWLLDVNQNKKNSIVDKMNCVLALSRTELKKLMKQINDLYNPQC